MKLPETIKARLTVENYRELLKPYRCVECDRSIAFSTTFDEPNNQSVGMVCVCGKRHPLGPTYWLPKTIDPNKRRPAPESLAEVLDRCGNRCWGCGNSYDVLHDEHRIGFHRHHTLPYTDHGHEGELIPLCTYCHQAITLVQDLIRKHVLKRDRAA